MIAVARQLRGALPSGIAVSLEVLSRAIESQRTAWLWAATAGGLTVLVAAAAALSAGDARLVAVGAAAGSVLPACCVSLGGSTLRRLLASAGAVATTTIAAAVLFEHAPTVVWLYAYVIPIVGLIHGPRYGALAGLLSAPALHLIETGVAIDLADPQTPFGVVILVLIGAIPGQLLVTARERREELRRQLDRTQAVLRDTRAAEQREIAARRSAVTLLAAAAEARDGTTGEHIYRVRDLASELATAAGLANDEVARIGWSAMLHDVGKLRVPDRILLKPGELSAEEWALVRQHPEWGAELMRGHEGFELARSIARWHHEDWAGTGYPDGLTGPQIPFAARLVRVVDVYDALVTERPYKPAWPIDRALAELRAMRGRALDPDLVDLFVGLRLRQG